MATHRDDPRLPLCRAFSDPLRVRILNLLKNRGELCKNDIADFFEMNRSELSRQLSLLERAHLIVSRLDHHFRYYRLSESLSPFHQRLLESLKCFEDLPEFLADSVRAVTWAPSVPAATSAESTHTQLPPRSQALPGNALQGRLCLRNASEIRQKCTGINPGGRASKTARSQAEPGNE